MELGKSGLDTVSAALRSDFTGSDRFQKVTRPTVKVDHAHFRQGVVLEILLKGVSFCNTVRDWRAGGKSTAFSVGDLVQILYFHIQVRCTGRTTGNSYVLHFCEDLQIFEHMGFVQKQMIYAQFLKVYCVVISLFVLQRFQLLFDLFPRCLHLLDGETASVSGVVQFLDPSGDLIFLLPEQRPFPFRRYRDHGKLAVSHNNGIIIAQHCLGEELFSLVLLKSRLCRHKDIGRGIEFDVIQCKLLCQVIGNNDQTFSAKSQPFQFLCRSDHLKGLPSPDRMSQQRVFAKQDSGNRIFLMRSQGNIRIHAWQL